MTWNVEGIKPHQYYLTDLLLAHLPDIVHLSEPQTYQGDIAPYLASVCGEYSYYLNSDDLYDLDLPFEKSRAVGGTLCMWKKWLDPYIHIHPVQTSAILPLILQLPGTKPSVHIGLYLPTSGKDYEFVTELASLTNCLEELIDLYDDPIVFIRGDGNSNPKNTLRFSLLTRFISEHSLRQINISHPTYHHFVGEGRFDSNIDIILCSRHSLVEEHITQILCKFDNPEISSHHDIVLSEFSLPSQVHHKVADELVVAPRLVRDREKIFWSDEGITAYRDLVSPQLRQLREIWEDPSSKYSTDILLQATNHVLTLAATSTNPSASLLKNRAVVSTRVPQSIKAAKRKLKNKYRYACSRPSAHSQAQLDHAKRFYRQKVREARLQMQLKRDRLLDTILSENPTKLYSYLRNCKKAKATKIEKLVVGKKIYSGNMVRDGFYDSMSSLKSCDKQALLDDPSLSEHFSNYDHIMKVCQKNSNIPEANIHTAAKILQRLKKHVTDINGVTVQHYMNAGHEGLAHFVTQLNCIISEVNNGTIDELNLALGLILYKGHRKEKNSDRSYRTISTCPLLAKALDLHLRDLYQDQWDTCTAATQYQNKGSSHELASLLITELVQYSLHVLDQPVYLLVLDAQSAFDRCLKEILCTELFMSGMSGSALMLVNNRLEKRSTVYQWDGEMLGPAQDLTGFEQGGINSGEFYKMYNNSQLKSAQASGLGVDIDSSTVSAVGQADDVILVANSVHNLMLLARLTESYCASYRVTLVSSKTKLLPLYLPKHEHLVKYAKLINPVTISGAPVEFVEEADHVGVLRSIDGNMPHILQRISSHKKVMATICSAGMGKGHRGNAAASLRVHLLHATPVLLSGLATLVLNRGEISILDKHYKCTLEKLQRLHPRTPRSAVFFLAGCLPFEALLHIRQLGLLSMVCHLPEDPLHIHAVHVLTSVPVRARSWFQQVAEICSKYGLPCPLHLLSDPLPKETFKKLVKSKIVEHWETVFRAEVASLTSLKYFKPELYSLTRPHYMWTTAASNPYECSKSTVLARMASGRHRSEALCRHWSSNKNGFCRAPTCDQVYGTLEHQLVSCPALSPVREKLYSMFLEKSVMFPSLHSTIRTILASDESVIAQFILEPLSFPELLSCFHTHGNRFIEQLCYLTRTFAFYIDKEYRKIVNQSELIPPFRSNVNNQPDPTNPVLVSVTGSSQPQHSDELSGAYPVVQTSLTTPAHTNLQSYQPDVQSMSCQYQLISCHGLSKASKYGLTCVTSQAVSTTLDLCNPTLARECVTGGGQGGKSQHSITHALLHYLPPQTQGSIGGFRDMGISCGHVSQVSPLTHHISSSPMLGT